MASPAEASLADQERRVLAHARAARSHVRSLMWISSSSRRIASAANGAFQTRAGLQTALVVMAIVGAALGGVGCGSSRHPASATDSAAAPMLPTTAPYRVPSESMEPTLHVGGRILVDLRAYDLRRPRVGDIVILHPPRGADDTRCGRAPEPGQACSFPTEPSLTQNFIKRIVAGPGDRLRILHGRVVLNGKPQKEPFSRPCRADGCDFPKEIRIPKGLYFMMGDNRGASDDSRFWGPVPKASIIGKKIAYGS